MSEGDDHGGEGGCHSELIKSCCPRPSRRLTASPHWAEPALKAGGPEAQSKITNKKRLRILETVRRSHLALIIQYTATRQPAGERVDDSNRSSRFTALVIKIRGSGAAVLP